MLHFAGHSTANVNFLRLCGGQMCVMKAVFHPFPTAINKLFNLQIILKVPLYLQLLLTFKFACFLQFNQEDQLINNTSWTCCRKGIVRALLPSCGGSFTWPLCCTDCRLHVIMWNKLLLWDFLFTSRVQRLLLIYRQICGFPGDLGWLCAVSSQ